jgi:hypothetical protein
VKASQRRKNEYAIGADFEKKLNGRRHNATIGRARFVRKSRQNQSPQECQQEKKAERTKHCWSACLFAASLIWAGDRLVVEKGCTVR